MLQKAKHYLWLFGVNLFISTFTFGGGYVVVPMIRKYFVEKKRLFSEDDLVEMAAVAQSVPGAIAINLSALAGKRVGGYFGTFISCIAAVLPPIVILGAISVGYEAFAQNRLIAAVLRGMQAGVAALITDLVINMYSVIRQQNSRLLTCMVPCVFFASFFLHLNVAFILSLCCLICLVQAAIQKRRPLL